jgi:hypothetical protein
MAATPLFNGDIVCISDSAVAHRNAHIWIEKVPLTIPNMTNFKSSDAHPPSVTMGVKLSTHL